MRNRLISLIFTSLAASLVMSQSSVAQVAAPPSLKPQLVAASDVVSTRDAGLLRQGLQAVDRTDWFEVRQAESQLRDSTAKDILTWYRARRDWRMSFDEMDRALTRLAGWPEITEIRSRAEEVMELSSLDARARVEWFENHGGARSGAGHIINARALEALGRNEEAMVEVRKAWHGRTLSKEVSQKTYARYKNKLTQDDHRKRVDFLLWTRQTTAAERMKSLLTPDWRALLDARSKLIRRARGVDSAVDSVSTELQSHPGLMFDRAEWRRRARLRDRITPLLRQIDGEAVPAAGRSRLWKARHPQVRVALKESDWQLAYELSAPHGMSSGRDFAEAEWTAGWIALRHLDNPERALQHFESLEKGVSTPISLSRAHYWKGRTLEAMNSEEEAQAAYAEAAQYRFSYYGQLAAEKAMQGTIDLVTTASITDEDRANFQSRSLVKAMRLFAENGWDASFRKFAYHLDDQLSRSQDFELLAELGREYHYADIGVRGAKAGLAKGVVAPDAAYPVVDYALLREPQVERSLMLALSRQESEMNPAAISHANARGLMQFIPRTARLEARRQGLPYRTSWLTDDPGYNMTLGGAHLDTLLRQFNGSYIMTAAAYNAGASRPQRWIGEYGDPRAGEVDPVDWVEFIPFSETRNYVQRVLENTQVYRNRLSGEPEDIRLTDDLQRGRFGNN
ncbi:MAG: lytic transglycosylase domain-containing protein [Henriciella sp.]|nr:lytic transglycosylase domain-containing protein [Henriciella sp.]MBO6694336.1 lytic transglycosylase domain-containing protein [Henriciella sp.]